jgi:hypothetical protein
MFLIKIGHECAEAEGAAARQPLDKHMKLPRMSNTTETACTSPQPPLFGQA